MQQPLRVRGRLESLLSSVIAFVGLTPGPGAHQAATPEADLHDTRGHRPHSRGVKIWLRPQLLLSPFFVAALVPRRATRPIERVRGGRYGMG